MFWLLLFSLLDGSFLVGAFAPFSFDYGVFFLLAALLFILMRTTPKQALLTGFFFGLGFFGAGVSWVYVSIHQYGNVAPFLAILITFLFVMILSLFSALQCYCFRKFFAHFSKPLQYLLFFPLLLSIFEIARGNITSFPWLFIGYTQLKTPLSGFAPIVGVYGLSFIVAMISGAILLIAEKISTKMHFLALGLIVLFFGVGFALQKHAWTKPLGQPFSVNLIQGNIPQTIKWDPQFIGENINLYKHLTLENLNAKLIVWPEGALPIYANQAEPFIRQLGLLAKSNQTNIIFGIPIQKNNKAYNGMLLVGDNEGEYLKMHLVPYGEYTPALPMAAKIMAQFQIAMANFSKGPKDQPPVTVDHIQISPFICYEIAFPAEVWRRSIESNVLLNISDDSWFGKSFAMWQQYQMAQMRARETGRPIITATNTGITALISPLGKTLAHAPLGQQTVLHVMVQPMTGKTPIQRLSQY